MPDFDKITQFLFKLQLAALSTRSIDYYVNFFSQQHHFVNQRHFLVAAAVNGFHHDSFNFFFQFPLLSFSSPARSDLERGEAVVGRWTARVHPRHVECDRLYNELIVCCDSRTPCRLLFSSEYFDLACWNKANLEFPMQFQHVKMWREIKSICRSVQHVALWLLMSCHCYLALIRQVQKEMQFNPYAATLPREKWDTWDPMLISEGLFSAANIFSSLKLVYIFSVNPHLGPLQVSLSRMVTDIMKFFFLYVLVLFAFSSGLNQLLWWVEMKVERGEMKKISILKNNTKFPRVPRRYYADLEKKRCPDTTTTVSAMNSTMDPNACVVWRRFAK